MMRDDLFFTGDRVPEMMSVIGFKSSVAELVY
jgi:hypothetical protein